MFKVISWTWFAPQVKFRPIIKSNIQCKDFGSDSYVKDDNEIRESGISEKSLLTFLTVFRPNP